MNPTEMIMSLGQLQEATLHARKRTGDDAIATQTVGIAGHVQVGRWVPVSGKRSKMFKPLTGSITINDAIAHLQGMGV
jgi:hypothetical protein